MDVGQFFNEMSFLSMFSGNITIFMYLLFYDVKITMSTNI